MLANIDGSAAMRELQDTGNLTLTFADGSRAILAEEDLLIDTAQTEGFVTETAGDWTVVLDTNLTEELKEEGYIRELTSKIQTMRKEAGFEVMDHIHVYFTGSAQATEILKKHEAELLHDVLGEALFTGESDGYVKEWKINDEPVTLGVKKL